MRIVQLLVACVVVMFVTVGQAQAALISGVTATSSKGTFSTYSLPHLTDGTGLSPSISLTATHSSNFPTMWMNNVGGSSGTLTFDLAGAYVLSDIAIWQYSYHGDAITQLQRGIRDFTLEYSTDGSNFTLLPGTNTLAISTGTLSEPVQSFALGGVTASHVRLNYLNNYGNTLFAGLSEVQFDGVAAVAPVPEPSTLALVGLGVIGLAAARALRRRKV